MEKITKSQNLALKTESSDTLELTQFFSRILFSRIDFSKSRHVWQVLLKY